MTTQQAEANAGKRAPTAEAVALIAVPSGTWRESGNWVTARRIAQNVAAHGWRAEACPADRLAARVAQGGVHVLHAIHARKSGVEVARVAAEAGLPYVVTCSGTDLAVDLAEPKARKAIRRAVRGAFAVTVFHENAAKVVRAALPDAAGRLLQIAPGIEELPGQADRAAFGLSEDEFVLLLPAGLRAVKRPDYAIAPLDRLRERYPEIRFVIAGPVLEEETGQALRRLAAERPWVRWLGGVPRERMGALYRSADVVLNTSIHEGLSNAVMEAMRIGRPLLLADNAGNRAAASADALYFKSPDDLLAGGERLVQNPWLRRRVGHAARLRAMRLFSVEREAAHYAELYAWARESGASEAAACDGER